MLLPGVSFQFHRREPAPDPSASDLSSRTFTNVARSVTGEMKIRSKPGTNNRLHTRPMITRKLNFDRHYGRALQYQRVHLQVFHSNGNSIRTFCNILNMKAERSFALPRGPIIGQAGRDGGYVARSQINEYSGVKTRIHSDASRSRCVTAGDEHSTLLQIRRNEIGSYPRHRGRSWPGPW